MKRREGILPEAPVYHLLWGIPASFGGMTTVALRRASLLADIGRRRMEVLTLSPDLTPRARQRELYREGLISRRVRIRNLWEELRSARDSALARLSEGTSPDGHADHERTPVTGRSDHVLTGKDDRVLQVARFRADGSLLLTDRQDVANAGTRGGRRLTLYARSGEPVGQWSSARSFYHAWLRFVVGAERSVIICDSAFVGGLMHSFASAHAALVQVIHSHHHDEENQDPGHLTAGKLPILKNADRYDLVAVLTERQKQHLLDEEIASDNVVAIPNPFPGRTGGEAKGRPRERGIIVSRLSGIKRLDHAIQALAASPTPATLDIYGDGEEREHLAQRITDLDISDRARLHGHDPTARDRFADSSFSLLTSRAEGQSLMIVESMAGGCIPIAYDIDYGPSDIITDGVDGFLVPAGSPDALADAIGRFLSLDDAQVARMREAAQATSKRFSAEKVADEWARELRQVLAADTGELDHGSTSGGPSTALDPTVQLRDVVVHDERHEEAHDGRAVFTVNLQAADRRAPQWAKLTLIGRRDQGYVRLPMRSATDGAEVVLTAEVPLDQLVPGASGVLDLFVDVRIAGTRVRVRLSADELLIPQPIGGLELYGTVHGNVSLRRAAGD